MDVNSKWMLGQILSPEEALVVIYELFGSTKKIYDTKGRVHEGLFSLFMEYPQDDLSEIEIVFTEKEQKNRNCVCVEKPTSNHHTIRTSSEVYYVTDGQLLP